MQRVAAPEHAQLTGAVWPAGLYQLDVTFRKASDLAPYLRLEWVWRGGTARAPTEEAPAMARQVGPYHITYLGSLIL